MSPPAHSPSIDTTIDVPGRDPIRVRDIPGPPGAPAVLLLHGLGATARLNWGACFRPLSQHFRVLSLDHRGHGHGLRTTHFRLEECADDAAGLLGALGVEPAIVVGYSMGGPIASLTWQRHSQQVLGLVLCATARHFVPRRMARLARMTLPMAASALRLVPDAARRRMVQRMLVRIEHPELRDRVREDFLGHEPATVIQAADALTRFSSHDWIGTVNVPTAVLLTTRDELVPPVRQRKLAASIPGAEVFEVDGDHDACMRAPAFAPTLVQACLSVARRAAASRGAEQTALAADRDARH
ncbi:alpha/beta fold hydrolase [Myxococcota bacterium]|nr:alpha/beta fold hydrolase [Myxococcota bacterium]MCZ7617640.1 alpha/beta hydrolase [Myxococcota bacterium]